MKELFIVTGASGRLGESFVKSLKSHKEVVVGISRKDISVEGADIFKADLINESEILSVFKGFNFSDFGAINIIHPVGKFRFQHTSLDINDKDGDGIDDEVYITNVITLKNILKVLMSHSKVGQKVKVCAFASISDKHNVPFWSSYTKSKNIVREYLKDLCNQGHVSALMVNVSTVDTGNENSLRPNADKTFWLKTEEIVKVVLSEISILSGYKEIDVFKEKPNFDKSYYLNHDAILAKWKKEMGEL